jgi:protocatechuate 4,5-dioxygenase beta chain
MAEIVAGIGVSHIPALGMAMSASAAPTEVFEKFAPVRDWVRELELDTMIVIYNDHGSAFSLEMLPTFAIGAAQSYAPADEGYGARDVPVPRGNVDLSWLVVNVVQQPTPTAQRCFDLGAAIGRAVASFPSTARVGVVGTGGMSHQLQGTRAGHINTEFDQMFLDAMVNEPQRLTAMSNLELIKEAGSEGAELIMWLVMRGALRNPSVAHRSYHVPVSNTAAGILALAESPATVAPIPGLSPAQLKDVERDGRGPAGVRS